ncbi:TetR/AcrR family transcriptional regulator [Kribbella sp. NPDC056861]|uniref:TetR/AcrR family transcriptional regulator n=1 Tax=Kribbella sp. NPDC056861 TaxID=3154857 RepID=UPI0034334B52
MAGRPRDSGLEKRLVAAGWELLTTDGYDALAMAQVAVKAGAHRTDVYRRWPSKARLVVDVLAEYLPPVPDVDTGSLLNDLRAFVQDLAKAWNSPWNDGLVGLLADLRHDEEANAAFKQIVAQRDQPVVNAIARAVQRGEIGQVPELPLVGDLLEGPLMHRRVFGGRPLSADDLEVVTRSAYRLLTGTAVTA